MARSDHVRGVRCNADHIDAVDRPLLDHFGLLARITVGRAIIDQFDSQLA